MKNEILRYQKYFQIEKLFIEYETLFESSTADQEAKAILSANLTEIAAIISLLMQPMSPHYNVRKSSREALREQARLFTGRGIALANQLQDEQMGHLLQEYHRAILKANSFDLKEVSRQIYTKLIAHNELLIDFGLSAEQLMAFKDQSESLDATEDQTTNSLSVRKAKRQQLRLLLKESLLMLKQQFDSFVQLQKDTASEFYSRYRALRRREPVHRSKDIFDSSSDISGMVKDSQSGAPVVNATINLLEHSFVMITGSDGLYFLEELPPGSYTVSCHAPGYAVPEVVTVELGHDDSVVINFDLQAVAATGSN